MPDIPILNTNYYDNLLAQAVTSPNTNYPAALLGKTNLVNRAIVVSGSITGSGILVVNGTVAIGVGAVIGNGITIIAKGALSITSTPLLGSNDVFYSDTGISIAKDNTFSAGHSALITPGNIDIQKTFQFAGLIYAGGNINMDKATGTEATIDGSVVAGGSLTLKKDFAVTYDASQLPESALLQFVPASPEVVNVKGTWSEIFPK